MDREKFKIKTPEARIDRETEKEGFIKVNEIEWDELCRKISQLNSMIDKAHILYKEDGWHTYGTTRTKHDTHECLAFGTQPIEEDEAEDILKDLVSVIEGRYPILTPQLKIRISRYLERNEGKS